MIYRIIKRKKQKHRAKRGKRKNKIEGMERRGDKQIGQRTLYIVLD